MPISVCILTWLFLSLAASVGICNVLQWTGRQKLFFLFITALLAAVCGWRAAATVESPISVAKMLLGYLVVSAAAATDWETWKIPNRLVAVLFAGRLLFLLPEGIWEPHLMLSRFISSLLGCLVCGLLLLLVSVLTKGGLGAGDIKLFAGIGFLSGLYAVLYTLIFACTACGLMSVFLLLSRRKRRKDSLPMGPFILFGYVLMILMASY